MIQRDSIGSPENDGQEYYFNDVEASRVTKKQKVILTRTNVDENVRIILVDFSNSLHRVDDGKQCLDENRKWELLLKHKFSLQQQGKLKWLFNRELKYQNFFPVEFMNDPKFVLNHIQKYDYGLEYASKRLQQDTNFVLQIFQLKGSTILADRSELSFTTRSIRNDPQVGICVGSSSTQRKSSSLYLPSLQDKEIMLTAVRQYGELLDCAKKDLNNDTEILFEAIKQNKRALRWVPKNLLRTSDFMLKCLQIIFPEFETLDSFDYSKKEIVAKLVSEFGFLLEFASPELKNNRDVVSNAVRNDGFSLKYASNELKNDMEIAYLAVAQNGCALQHVSHELRGDKNLVLAAVNQNGNSLDSASVALQSDKEIVLAAVTKSGHALYHASKELKRDRQVALAAVRQNGYALKYMADHLTCDQEIVLEAVRTTDQAFQYGSSELFADQQFLLQLIQFGCKDAFFYAPDKFAHDKEFLSIAIQLNSVATIKSYNRRFGIKTSNKDMVLQAVKKDGFALSAANKELQQDPELVREALKCNGYVLGYSDELYQARMEQCYDGVYLENY
ncbi:hypothetical protein C9374_005900 [Naegleria lovaniensis]|uniref:DUF4116 domain-containing protein n=1 Tax=Naegleria lovaniensis TaxID=51637 RepID=A0AA88GQ40_NAELO|nr:uncharacterized protein C9374_005900 [Naegleria lovaniensis]KAG2382108.1 hypothetical protein C9374_005900 [Naegleria lovaniensis]